MRTCDDCKNRHTCLYDNACTYENGREFWVKDDSYTCSVDKIKRLVRAARGFMKGDDSFMTSLRALTKALMERRVS